MEPEADEKDVFLQSWNKMAKSLHREGYREGSATGREKTFQQGFDCGYVQGFEIGYRLGLHNGVLKYLSSDKTLVNPTVTDKLSSVKSFEKSSRGFCVLCPKETGSKDTPRTTNSIEETIKIQNEKSNQEEHKLKTDDFRFVLREIKLDTLCDSSCKDNE